MNKEWIYVLEYRLSNNGGRCTLWKRRNKISNCESCKNCTLKKVNNNCWEYAPDKRTSTVGTPFLVNMGSEDLQDVIDLCEAKNESYIPGTVVPRPILSN